MSPKILLIMWLAFFFGSLSFISFFLFLSFLSLIKFTQQNANNDDNYWAHIRFSFIFIASWSFICSFFFHFCQFFFLFFFLAFSNLFWRVWKLHKYMEINVMMINIDPEIDIHYLLRVIIITDFICPSNIIIITNIIMLKFINSLSK